MSESYLGFGHQPFGHFPFGSSDWAESVTFELLPEFIREADKNAPGKVNEPLRGLMDALKPSLEELRLKIQGFPVLWNADEAPVGFLPPLARAIGLEPTTDKDETSQRLEILNANQLYIHKGTDKGYEIVAAFEGLTVEIVPLWAETCEPGANLTPDPPTTFFPLFDDVPLDTLHLDSFFDDRFAIWPLTLLFTIQQAGMLLFDETPLDTIPLDSGVGIIEGRCRSHKLRLTFSKADDTEIEEFEAVARRVLKFIEFMRPAHVQFDRVRFDGPKAAVSWVAPVTGDTAAAVSWVAPITGFDPAAASWTTAVTGDLAG